MALKKLPDLIENEAQLEDLLATPDEGLIEDIKAIDGDIMLLGAGGKIGPSQARLAAAACQAAGVKKKVYAVSRSFGDSDTAKMLKGHGVETIACDLLDEKSLNALPDVKNILFLAGMKFGSSSNESLVWAMNAFMPGLVARRFQGSRIVSVSSGNVFGLNSIFHGGAVESQTPAPFGDYAMSVLGRDRIFEHFSRTTNTPVANVRLFYAVETRYGIFLDIAEKILHNTPIDITMGNLNCIWQGDANSQILRCLRHASCPAKVITVTGPEIASVRWIAKRLGELLGKEPQFTGSEAPDAILGNSALASRLFGYPQVPLDQAIIWVANWAKNGGPTLGKPTKFQVRDGKF